MVMSYLQYVNLTYCVKIAYDFLLCEDYKIQCKFSQRFQNSQLFVVFTVFICAFVPCALNFFKLYQRVATPIDFKATTIQ